MKGLRSQVNAAFAIGAATGFVVGATVMNWVNTFAPPRTPADWKAGYEAAVKAEQARHAEAMGIAKENK